MNFAAFDQLFVSLYIAGGSVTSGIAMSVGVHGDSLSAGALAVLAGAFYGGALLYHDHPKDHTA